MLIDTGHSVRALARNTVNELRLREIGAEPVRASLFDVSSLRGAVGDSEAILHLATHIPASSQIGVRDAWRENDRIRIEGTRNLVNVALESAVSTFIYPGVVFAYPDAGDQWLDALTPPDRSPLLESSFVAEAEVERFTKAGKRGIVLRMGCFYGPTAGSTRDLLRAARWGIAMLFGAANAYQSLIWIEDAAVAVVDALSKAPAGIYDVVDDEPLRRRELAFALAETVGRRWLLRPPTFLLWIWAGKNGMFLARSQRVSNRRLKEATGWSPTVASARLGLKLLAIEP
jgi:nucleoside-diphosphate-sugar epimerase